MSKLLILGAGGHGKVVADIAKSMNYWDEICFLDDDIKKLNSIINGFKVIGRFDDYKKFKESFTYAFVAIGNNKYRLSILEELEKVGYKIPVIKHNFSYISDTVQIGEGTVIMPGVVINTNTIIGKGCIINTSSSIDHDCILKDGVHISPGANIGGTVNIGKCTWVCIGSKIINNVTIGKNVIIAAGSVVTKNIPDNIMVAGIPAIFKKNVE
ncbi:acetyltransferase [Thermovenabulum sp.]|uniref:acetyltransferase n=1 Tax=Thermovenabulum sp. TaxID=3100335 RepID=UPI003C7A9C59